MPTRRAIIRALKLAVAGGLFYYIFRVVPFAAVLQSLRSARLGLVLAGLALLLACRVIAAARMKLLTARLGLRFSLLEIFEIGTTATFYGLVLPGIISGGMIRWYKLARQGEPVYALASLIWDRLADATGVALIGIGCWLLSRPSAPRAAVGPALVVGGIVLVASSLAGFSRGVGDRVFPRIERVARRLRSDRLRLRVEQMAAAGRRYQDDGAGLASRVAVLTVASQLAGALAFLCWARSLGSGVGFAELTLARSCYLLTVLLPITFAGLGAREGILMLLLRPYGVSGANAVALAFIQLGGTLVLAAFGGLFELKRVWLPSRPEPEPVAPLEGEE